MPFPYVEAAGTPYEMGRQHGRQVAEQVRGFCDHLVRSSGYPREEVLRAASRFLPAFERYCPVLLEEVRGLADGADLAFEEALLLQIRGEVLPLLAEVACTSFAVSPEHAGGGLLIGQTSDMEPELERHFLVLHLVPREGPRTLMWTFAGQLGYHGLNEYGVAHFANSVSGGPEAPEPRWRHLPHYPVKRRLYECRTRAEVLSRWESMPVCSSGNTMLCAGGEFLSVEATPAGVGVLDGRGQPFLVHANHFLSSRFRTPGTDAAALPDSFARQERMTALLAEHRGRLGVSEIKAILADHAGHPCGICRHEETDARRMGTVAGLISEPERGRLHVSRGTPCRGDWTCYEV